MNGHVLYKFGRKEVICGSQSSVAKDWSIVGCDGVTGWVVSYIAKYYSAFIFSVQHLKKNSHVG